MPDSYGASLAGVGRWGPSRREAKNDKAANAVASTMRTTIGRYWATDVALSGPRPDRLPGHSWPRGGATTVATRPASRAAIALFSLLPGPHLLVPPVQRVARHEEDHARAQCQNELRLAHRPEVTLHDDVGVGLGRVRLRRRDGAAGRRRSRQCRLHPQDHIVGASGV